MESCGWSCNSQLTGRQHVGVQTGGRDDEVGGAREAASWKAKHYYVSPLLRRESEVAVEFDDGTGDVTILLSNQ